MAWDQAEEWWKFGLDDDCGRECSAFDTLLSCPACTIAFCILFVFMGVWKHTFKEL